MAHEILALSGFYLGAYLLWFAGRMIKTNLGRVTKPYGAAEGLLYFVVGVFAFILLLWWLSTTWVRGGLSEIGGFGVVFTAAWLVYTFIRKVILWEAE